MLKKIFELLPLFSIIILLDSCKINKTDLSGTYVAKNLINNIDTLKIFENGTYSKVLYRKNNNSLIYKNTGKWTYNGKRIVLYDFFSDEDEIHTIEEKNFEDILITSSFTIDRKFNKIVIYYMDLTDYKYYEKQ